MLVLYSFSNEKAVGKYTVDKIWVLFCQRLTAPQQSWVISEWVGSPDQSHYSHISDDCFFFLQKKLCPWRNLSNKKDAKRHWVIGGFLAKVLSEILWLNQIVWFFAELDRYRVSLKKGTFVIFCLISVLEVGFYFFTCVSESEFWARFILLFKKYPFRILTVLKTLKTHARALFLSLLNLHFVKQG